MTEPIIFIAIPLIFAFLAGLTGRIMDKRSIYFLYLSLGLSTLLSLKWAFVFFSGSGFTGPVPTSGVSIPFSIALQVGPEEAYTLLLVNLLGLLGLASVYRYIRDNGRLSAVIYLLYFMALNGIVLTRDIFNYFVFIEISTIAVAGLLLFKRSGNLLRAGFSWLIASGFISIFLILGAVLIYFQTGVLDIDTLLEQNSVLVYSGSAAAFFLFISLLLELKPFPANGWALDVYEWAPPEISAILSGAGVTAGLFALYKFLPVTGGLWIPLLTIIGLVTFVFSHLIALKQEKTNRMLGYSSIGQAGLIAAVISMKEILGNDFLFIASSLTLIHALSKAGLFWLSRMTQYEYIKDWAGIKKRPVLVFLTGLFIFALLGLPPFPSFFAKWMLIMNLSGVYAGWLIAAILIGSLLEATYLFRWFGLAVKGDVLKENPLKKSGYIVPLITAILILLLSALFPAQRPIYSMVKNSILPLLFVAFFFVFDFLPAKLKNVVLISGLGYHFYTLYPQLTEFRFIFSIVFLIGGMILLLAGFNEKGKRVGFYPSSAMMYAGLAGILTAETTLSFFFWWELMTLGSYFLILRGKKSMSHALSYMLFSLGGAFCMLAGFGLLSAVNGGNLALETLSSGGSLQALIFILLTLGFLTKTAAIPLHIWLPGAHSEAENDVSPVVSAVLLKAGVFGLIIVMLGMGPQEIKGVNIYTLLGWLGAITALIGNLSAVFEEDAKRLLAYSSVGQLGYVLFALSMLNHIGWLSATVFALNHFIYKSLLFLAVGGVVLRVKTRNMYEMGGLIKRMPVSFISVMIGIIALSGVPPLTGFAGKWLSYNATILSGWYLQGALVSFAGLVAFLYCFRLIFAIFLGQLKDNHRRVKEAPFWFILPQLILMGALMWFSVIPNTALKPVGKFLVNYFPDNALTWEGGLATSLYGYWNGTMVMYVTGVVFVTVFIWLIFISRKAVKIKQFNIVYAAERPSRPELTHFAYNFFAPYKKALGFLVAPVSTDFWNSISENTHSLADIIRRILNGNSQTYAIHLILFIVLCFFYVMGGTL